MQAPQDVQGQTLYDHFTIFTLDPTLPDIRIRDEITDPSETDWMTGSAARHYVRRVKRWPGSHIQLEVDRIATKPTA